MKQENLISNELMTMKLPPQEDYKIDAPNDDSRAF